MNFYYHALENISKKRASIEDYNKIRLADVYAEDIEKVARISSTDLESYIKKEDLNKILENFNMTIDEYRSIETLYSHHDDKELWPDEKEAVKIVEDLSIIPESYESY